MEEKVKRQVAVIILLTVIFSLVAVGCGAKKISGDNNMQDFFTNVPSEDKFKDFYYTYATTVNPPEFQRYRFYKEDGKFYFYHEKREGDSVFLTEEDITVYGTKELTDEEWETFWKLIGGGSVKKRKESTNSGGSGPWLYLYWDGDKDIYQEFSFKEYENLYEFEEFCEGLVESMNDMAIDNPEMVDDTLSFDQNICGTYKGEEGDGWEVRYWDISNIDGKYYLDYIGEYDYMAAEIELLDETPYPVGDELRYMVRVYPFSGFSFGGEYQGAGQVMYISANLATASKTIILSEGNPFFYGEQFLHGVEEVNLHKTQDNSVMNRSVPEIIGAWRCVISDEENEYNIFMQFEEDGRVDIVRKREGYTPMIYRGIYALNDDGDTYKGNIEAEAIGMGTQPVAEWTLEFDPNSDHPIIIYDEFEDGNPLVYGADDMVLERTQPGKSDRFIHPGPWERTDEVVEMYDEYLSVADAEFIYDFAPEYIEAIHTTALELTNSTEYISYGIQDNKKGGEIWIQVLSDADSSGQVTKNWVRYDFGESGYYDIYDNCLDGE